jgi:hypothetical protein
MVAGDHIARRIVLGLLHLTEPNWISRPYFSTEIGTRGQFLHFYRVVGAKSCRLDVHSRLSGKKWSLEITSRVALYLGFCT